MPNWCNNTLCVSGPADELERFRRKAIGPTQNYNEFRAGAWEAFDDIRIKAIISTSPDLGEASELSFHALYPVPDEVMCLPYDKNQAKKITDRCGVEFDGIAGYEWESSNWGVKWGGTDTCAYHSDGLLQYDFNTAWAPPLPFLEKVSKDFPKLDFTLSYSEPGMGFEGKAVFETGSCIEDDCWELDETEIEE